jgi:hypothetical protein
MLRLHYAVKLYLSACYGVYELALQQLVVRATAALGCDCIAAVLGPSLCVCYAATILHDAALLHRVLMVQRAVLVS